MISLGLNIVAADDDERSSLELFFGEHGWSVDSYADAGELIRAARRNANPVSARSGKKAAAGDKNGNKHLLIYSVPETEEAFQKEKDTLSMYLRKNKKVQLILIIPGEFHGGDKLGIELGARHILFKPYSYKDLEEMLSRIATGLGKRRLKQSLNPNKEIDEGFDQIIGESPKIMEVKELALKVAESECTSVIITGECGTGKGSLAKAIHEASPRRSGPFVEVNCAAIPRNLLESEFFGHEKGAFTDAREEKAGLFEVADGGTIFLDEIAEIDYALQAKLLKFLDTRTIRRVSGVEFLPVDVRIISATNRNLKEEVAQGRFREDLYYRLNVVEINLPPLRERKEDIRPIAIEYVSRFAARLNKGGVTISEEALDALQEYHWPGNIRELINVIERAVLLNRSGKIKPEDLPIESTVGASGTTPNGAPDGTPNGTSGTTPNGTSVGTSSLDIEKEAGTVRIDFPPEGIAIDEVEKGLIIAALEKSGGRVTEAARLLRLGRGALRYKMKKYGIDADEFKYTLV
ncbi:MAG: hypothetical protein B6D63_00145 [Candidatus Latescibacteria bacterium 4484_7]|nr:MAG: hypothetical protein B6D63_00145 [Candidatus Latescibacteria bacterium 4484_7]